jgi:hypothetical protein
MKRGRELRGRGGAGLEKGEVEVRNEDAGEETSLHEHTILLRQPAGQY